MSFLIITVMQCKIKSELVTIIKTIYNFVSLISSKMNLDYFFIMLLPLLCAYEVWDHVNDYCQSLVPTYNVGHEDIYYLKFITLFSFILIFKNYH